MNDEQLLRCWWAGVRAVDGRCSVRDYLDRERPPAPDQLIAVGKAAEAMVLGALDHYGETLPWLLATKHGHLAQLDGENALCAGHPTPDRHSLRAGRRIAAAVAAMGPGERLLLLISGGASAIAEWPEPPITLAQLVAANEALLSGGLDIAAINAERVRRSRIKGGKLLRDFAGAGVLCLALSDVRGDDIAVIGAGLGAPAPGGTAGYQSAVVAANTHARAAAADCARALGQPLQHQDEALYGDIAAAAAHVAATLRRARPGVCVFGGEPTVVLPPHPGRGGRNQALALTLAREIAGERAMRVLVAGTDGSDGPTDAAGAVVDGRSWRDDGAAALAAADAGRWLERRGLLLRSGPTGTNVMDLVIGWRGP